MGCGCGGGGSPSLPAGGSSTGGAYMLIQADGKKTFYSTESGARAANARTGGSGLVKKT